MDKCVDLNRSVLNFRWKHSRVFWTSLLLTEMRASVRMLSPLLLPARQQITTRPAAAAAWNDHKNWSVARDPATNNKQKTITVAYFSCYIYIPRCIKPNLSSCISSICSTSDCPVACDARTLDSACTAKELPSLFDECPRAVSLAPGRFYASQDNRFRHLPTPSARLSVSIKVSRTRQVAHKRSLFSPFNDR